MNDLIFITGEPCSGKSHYAGKLESNPTTKTMKVIKIGDMVRNCVGKAPFGEGLLDPKGDRRRPCNSTRDGAALYSRYLRQFEAVNELVLGIVATFTAWFYPHSRNLSILGYHGIIIDGFPRSSSQVGFLCQRIKQISSGETRVEVHWMDPTNSEWMYALRERMAGASFGYTNYMRMVFEQQRFVGETAVMDQTLRATFTRTFRQSEDKQGLGRIVFRL